MNDIVLQCDYLTKTYAQGENTIYAVRDCKLSIARGEFIAVVGASGSGKSTLLHLLSAFDRPSFGRVYIEKEDIFSFDDREISKFRNEKIGFIFQNFNLLPILTAKENILVPTLIGKKYFSKIYFDELTEMLKIRDRLNHLPGELSGGQQQRVAVARALINKPSIVFADEPTGNLDTQTSAELMNLLIETKEQLNQTLIIVTHDMSIAERADKRFRMIDGVLYTIK